MQRLPLSHRTRRTPLERLNRTLRRSRYTLRRLPPRQIRRTRLRRRLSVFVIALAAAVVFGFASWPSLRAHMQAIAILRVLGGQPVPALLAPVMAAPLTTEDINFPVPTNGGATQSVRAREYLPSGNANAPALIVLHGVHHLGIDEPRLEAFATSIANCGVRVLTPELPDIKDYHVDATSIRTIGESAKWFAARTGGPVGVVGLSFSGGLALVAASEPAYKNSFRFVLAVGAQDSMGRVAEYYRTGADPRPNGSVEELKPHEYGPLVLEYEYVEDFVPPADVPAIRTVLRAHLYEDKAAEKTTMAALTPAQQAEAKELMDTKSLKTQASLAASNERNAEVLAELSPHGRLETLTVPVYLLHGEADNIIPSAETLWMETELPRSTLKAALVSPVISHIDFESSQPTALDQWRLIHFFAQVMEAAERPVRSYRSVAANTP
jgi:pimeloyl-ACP methyl ester carboxylesterase